MSTVTEKKPDRFKTIARGIGVGRMVLWYPRANRQHAPCPAVVTTAGNGDCLKLLVFRPSGAAVERNGVRHVDDPFYLEHVQVAENVGSFDFLDQDPLEDVGAMRRELDALKAEVRQLRGVSQKVK